jgi:hypothetical protein
MEHVGQHSPDDPPTRETVRQVLVAAADVAFGDGVSPRFLDQWVDETCFLLSLAARDRHTATLREVAGGSKPR